MQELKNLLSDAQSQLGRDAISIITDDLTIHEWDDRGLKGACPFHTKDGKVENTPSFIWNDKDNAFKCFGCGKRYGIMDHFRHKGLTFKQSASKLFELCDIDYTFHTTQDAKYRYPKPETNDSIDKVRKYLASRKISKETIDYCGIKEDKQGNIVFEYYDTNDTLMTTKYRPSRKLKSSDSKSWSQKDADTTHLLWGMNKVVYDSPLFITEGELDRCASIEVGVINTVSIPFGANNYHWIEENWDFLDRFDEIVICSDNDEAGQRMFDEVVPRLGEWRCKKLNYDLGDGKQYNDLNDILYKCGKHILKEVLESAKDVPIKNVKKLSEVEDIDLSKALGIKSGISELDKRLARMFLGTLAVWTGINGSGKSTFVNQVAVAEPTNQGYKTFIFSGELTDSQLKNWIEYPMAGVNNILEINTTPDQPTFYKVDPSVKKLISTWYDDMIYLYDDEFDKTGNSILKSMELMVRKHGVKNIVIDNLMTVDISKFKGDSIFEKQKEFVLELVKFAIRYKVVIHLVAHPRKLDMVKRLTKMDVSGTGDITNLAHYVFAVHRVTNREKEGIKNGRGDIVTEPIEFDTLIDVFKNRPIGFQDFTIGLYFHPPSKRFYKNDRELHKKYGWDTSSNTKVKTTPFD